MTEAKISVLAHQAGSAGTVTMRWFGLYSHGGDGAEGELYAESERGVDGKFSPVDNRDDVVGGHVDDDCDAADGEVRDSGEDIEGDSDMGKR